MNWFSQWFKKRRYKKEMSVWLKSQADRRAELEQLHISIRERCRELPPGSILELSEAEYDGFIEGLQIKQRIMLTGKGGIGVRCDQQTLVKA